MDSGMATVRIGRNDWGGDCAFVARPRGLVVMAHEVDAACNGAQQRQVCAVLHGYRLSTLVFDPPAGAASPSGAELAVVERAAGRIVEVLGWLRDSGEAERVRVGLFGAELCAAAALLAVAQRPGMAAAVVARSGRTDLVAAWLPRVQVPTLLVVGAGDAGLVQANRLAMRALTCSKRLEIVPAAGPLGDEPAALDAAAHLAGSWFVNHLAAGAPH